MTAPYSELIQGALHLRLAPGPRHERICARLHELIHASVANMPAIRLLPPRARINLDHQTALCPDLGLVAAATNKLWLAAEIVSADDHRPDTVVKKQVYEEHGLARLWMIDPRYDNVEVYHGSPYGLALKTILGGREILTEKIVPEFQVAITELFKA
jgi:Uma2 family endonuclease